MGTFGVVPEEPVNEEVVEASDIVSQCSAIAHDAIFGDRPIEPLDMGVHLRRAWVCVVPHD